ncbi:MAG TPA: hypothetical protein VMT52_03675, partial [Planctomycetota bacterium]|nr:hypothetical protein [Planctomycetota bacterium]
LGYSTRDGINIVRYALKMAHQVREAAGEGAPGPRARGRPAKPGAASAGAALANWKDHFRRSVQRILGEDALDLKKRSLRKEPIEYVDLREFFAAVEDLRPSNPAEEDADETKGGEGDEKGEGREDPDARPRRPDRGGKPGK